MSRERRRESYRVLRVDKDARVGAWLVRATQAGVRLAHGQRSSNAPPGRNQHLQIGSGLPNLSKHRLGSCRTQSAKCQRGDKLRLTMEPGKTGTTDRAR